MFGKRFVKILIIILVIGSVHIPIAEASTVDGEVGFRVPISDRIDQFMLDMFYGEDTITYSVGNKLDSIDDGETADLLVVFEDKVNNTDFYDDFDVNYDDVELIVNHTDGEVYSEDRYTYRIKMNPDDVMGGYFYGLMNRIGMDVDEKLIVVDYVDRIYYNNRVSVGDTMLDMDHEDTKDPLDLGVTTDDINDLYDVGNHSQDSRGGEGVSIAVLDTGVYFEEDYGSYDYNETNETDGKLVVESTFVGKDGLDRQGHGSHVISIIGGQKTYWDHEGSGENISTEGIAPNSTIHSVQVLDSGGQGASSNLVEGLEYAIDQDVDIISMSLGGNMLPFTALYDSIKRARANDIILIAAAGNDGVDGRLPLAPAIWNGVLSVGSCNRDGFLSWYSNLGFDVMAVGHDVTAPAYYNGDFRPVTISGTSMATPVVTGMVARFLSDFPVMRDDATEVMSRVRDTGSLDNPDGDYELDFFGFVIHDNYIYDFPEVSIKGIYNDDVVYESDDHDSVLDFDSVQRWRTLGYNP